MGDTLTKISSGFFDSIGKDRLYHADDMNKPYRDLFSDGLYGADTTGFRVTAGTGLTVNVAAGTAMLGKKWVNTDGKLLAVPANDSMYTRIDSVILRTNENANVRASHLIYRTGTPASSPTAPALVTSTGIHEFRLANVSVAAGATAVGTITDRRGTSECPWAQVNFSSSQMVSSIQALLVAHPELATFVPDGGITKAKLASDVIDQTLSVSGSAADAKKTGDAISDVNNALDYIAQMNMVQGVLENHSISSTGYFTDATGFNLYYAFVYGFDVAVVSSDDVLYGFSDVIPFHNGRTNDETRHESSQILNNTEITIPEGTKYLVIRATTTPIINIKGNVAVVSRQNENYLKNIISSENINIDSLSPESGYVNADGGISSHANYRHNTTPVLLNAGDTIIYTTSSRKVESPVVILSRLENGVYIPICKSNGNDYSYTITIPKDGNYIFTNYIESLTGTLIVRTYIETMLRNTIEYISEEKEIDYLPLFHNVICIGDSLTRGYNTTYESGQENRDFGYPWALSRLTRLNVYNYGHSGSTAESWLNSESELDYSTFDMAIICLGRNGGLSTTAEQTAYNTIISNIKTSNPHCTIFALSLPAYKDIIQSADVTTNGIIESIAETNNIPYIDIWGDYGAEKYRCGANDPHYKPVGYLKMAETIIEKINEYIKTNDSDFINLWMPKTLPLYIDGLVE